jgi:hypothetical protein
MSAVNQSFFPWTVLLGSPAGACFGVGFAEWWGNGQPWFMLLAIPGVILAVLVVRGIRRSSRLERERIEAMFSALDAGAARVPRPGSCKQNAQDAN